MDRTIEQFASDLERIDRTLSEISTYNKRFMSAVESLPDAEGDSAAPDGEPGNGHALDLILDSVQHIHALQQRQSLLVNTRIGQLGTSSSASPSLPLPPAPPEPIIPEPVVLPFTEDLLVRTAARASHTTAVRPGVPVPASSPALPGPTPMPTQTPTPAAAALPLEATAMSAQAEPEAAETNIDAESVADSTLSRSSLPKTKSASQTDLDQVVQLEPAPSAAQNAPISPVSSELLDLPSLAKEVVLRLPRPPASSGPASAADEAIEEGRTRVRHLRKCQFRLAHKYGTSTIYSNHTSGTLES